MFSSQWTAWPTREALSRLGVPRVRIAIDIALSAWAVYSAYASDAFPGRRVVLPPLGLLCCAAAVVGYHRMTLANRLLPSLGLLVGISACGAGAYAAGASIPATVLWICVSVMAMERLPLVFGLGTATLRH
ncbi:hypothetical protein ACQEVG_28840 [Streptomyces sp. CA-135486]|uniref:hypothetical protein n=1 Tax=Streptomyces sp. CA-135486 TaxID=3240049 RepID=UPI003D8FC0EF